MARPIIASKSPEQGFGRVMTVSQAQQSEILKEQAQKRQSLTEGLKEKWENTKGMSLGNGKLDEIFNESPRKGEALVLFLENTEKDAMKNRDLLSNMKLKEEVQTSDFLGITPQDIVKVSRIAYLNSVAPELFDFWGMTSMKDSLYKIESTYGGMKDSAGSADATPRGATAGGVTYESYNDGRYPSEYEQEVVDTTVSALTYSGTAEYVPMRPWSVKVIHLGEQVAIDDGNGNLVGADLDPAGVNTINYTTGAFTLTFLVAIGASDELYVEYGYNSEKEDLFYRTGSVQLNLVSYDFRASMWPLAVEWTRMTEELMESKLGVSARDTLIASAGDIFKKSMDEFTIARGIRASKWSTPEVF